MTNEQGQLIPTQNIVLRVQDQCQKWYDFTQVIEHPVLSPTEICGGASQTFPMFNADIPVQDLLYDGQSLLTGNVTSSQVLVDAAQEGDYWKLNTISGKLVNERWTGNLVLVDTCGFETAATITVRDCLIPNVFTPDGRGSGGNNSFRIQGLEGFEWSRLTSSTVMESPYSKTKQVVLGILSLCGQEITRTATLHLKACINGSWSGLTDSKMWVN